VTLPQRAADHPDPAQEPFDDPDWLFDFKYDGFRALAYLEHRRCRLISRNGNHLDRFDELGAALAALLDLDDAILDGEVIADDDSGRPQFSELLRCHASARLCRLRPSVGRWRRPALLAAQRAP